MRAAAARGSALCTLLFLGSYLSRKRARQRRKQTRSVARRRRRGPLPCFVTIAHHWTKTAIYVKSPAAKGARVGTSGQTYGKPSSRGSNARFGLEWGQSLRLGRTSASDGGPWIHEETTAVTKAGPCVPRYVLPPHGPDSPSSPLRASLNKPRIFARPPRRQDIRIGPELKWETTGARMILPHVITPMTSVALSAPTPPHPVAGSRATLAPVLPGPPIAVQAVRSATRRVQSARASARPAIFRAKRGALNVPHDEATSLPLRVREAP